MKKKYNYKQLNIEKALKNKDEYYLDDTIVEKKDNKSLTIFDFINDIRKYKTGKLLEDESNNSVFNSFMILKFLSMKEDDVPICNYLNKYCNILTKEQMYFALINLIEKDNRFYKYINKKSEIDDSEYVIKYFSCSKKEAISYVELMGSEWTEKIKNKYKMEIV